MRGYSAFTKPDETEKEKAVRGLGLTKEQLEEAKKKQQEKLKEYEESLKDK